MPKVSVIVPIYNTEKYLARCIDSILAQTFTDFELILVDDGSKDNSGKICDEYAQKDSRIVVVHKENGGTNKARETGVNKSTGEWITFVDSDDTLLINALAVLCDNISFDFDIIVGQVSDNVRYKSQYILEIENYRNEIIKGKLVVLSHAKLYRKEIFKYNIFTFSKEIIIGEDMIMNIRLSFETNNKVLIIPNKIYNYLYRSDSLMNTRVISIGYENKFWKVLEESIPECQKKSYEQALFCHAYAQWEVFCGYAVDEPQEWIESGLNKFLLVNFYKYKSIIPYIDRRLICTNNKLYRTLLIVLKKVNNHLPNCLKFISKSKQ